jgi:hypothetical protein
VLSLELKRHPSVPCAFARAFTVRAEPSGGQRLQLRYRLEGDLDRLELPLPRASAAADGLWRHTCFEAFVKAGDARAYLELNFSPFTEWAIYAFNDYRSGMQPRVPRERLAIASRRTGDVFELEATVDFEGLFTEWPRAAGLRLGLSAVLEDRQGQLSYWALAHPSERADFHHPESFALHLPPLGAPA